MSERAQCPEGHNIDIRSWQCGSTWLARAMCDFGDALCWVGPIRTGDTREGAEATALAAWDNPPAKQRSE